MLIIPHQSKLPLPLGRKLSTGTTIKLTIPKSFALRWVKLFYYFYCVSQANFYLVLHPKHKLKYFEQAGWENEWVEKAEELVRTEFERSYKYTNNDFFAQTEPTVRRK